MVEKRPHDPKPCSGEPLSPLSEPNPVRPLARVPNGRKTTTRSQALQCLNVRHCLPIPNQIPSDPLPGFRMVEKRQYDPKPSSGEPLSPHSEPNPARPLARVTVRSRNDPTIPSSQWLSALQVVPGSVQNGANTSPFPHVPIVESLPPCPVTVRSRNDRTIPGLAVAIGLAGRPWQRPKWSKYQPVSTRTDCRVTAPLPGLPFGQEMTARSQASQWLSALQVVPGNVQNGANTSPFPHVPIVESLPPVSTSSRLVANVVVGPH